MVNEKKVLITLNVLNVRGLHENKDINIIVI